MSLDVRTIGLICIIGGAVLFVRQIIRKLQGKTTKCDCGDLFPRVSEDNSDKKD